MNLAIGSHTLNLTCPRLWRPVCCVLLAISYKRCQRALSSRSGAVTRPKSRHGDFSRVASRQFESASESARTNMKRHAP